MSSGVLTLYARRVRGRKPALDGWRWLVRTVSGDLDKLAQKGALVDAGPQGHPSSDDPEPVDCGAAPWAHQVG